jgi:hypothetical protein
MHDIASEELASFAAGKLTLPAFVLASIFKFCTASSIAGRSKSQGLQTKYILAKASYPSVTNKINQQGQIDQ